MSYQDKVWAKRVADLPLHEVEDVRSTADKWRTALLALTGLFATVTIVSGPESVADLTVAGRALTAVLVGLAFFALLVGSGCAMRAAYGFPSKEAYVNDKILKQWSGKEAVKARRLLVVSAISFFAAMVFVAAAIAVTWFDDDLFSDRAPRTFVLLERGDGVEPHRVCAELVSLTSSTVTLKRPPSDAIDEDLQVPLTAVRAMTAVASCDR